ncbi:MAG: hypothetical protein GC154_16015 [bacterium]|nr:hypothetical protein [bacterium]
MSANGVLSRYKIFVYTNDAALFGRIRNALDPRGAVLFYSNQPAEAIAKMLSVNPDLLIVDEDAPLFHNSTVLSVVRKQKPRLRVMLVTRHESPLRSIDVSCQGVSFSLAHDSNEESIYNGVKHSLSISSVPRVETSSAASA